MLKYSCVVNKTFQKNSPREVIYGSSSPIYFAKWSNTKPFKCIYSFSCIWCSHCEIGTFIKEWMFLTISTPNIVKWIYLLLLGWRACLIKTFCRRCQVRFVECLILCRNVVPFMTFGFNSVTTWQRKGTYSVWFEVRRCTYILLYFKKGGNFWISMKQGEIYLYS